MPKECTELTVSELFPELEAHHADWMAAEAATATCSDDEYPASDKKKVETCNSFCAFRDVVLAAPMLDAADLACMMELYKMDILAEHPSSLFSEVGPTDGSQTADAAALRIVRFLSENPKYAAGNHGISLLAKHEARVKAKRERIAAPRYEYEQVGRKREAAAEQLRGLC